MVEDEEDSVQRMGEDEGRDVTHPDVQGGQDVERLNDSHGQENEVRNCSISRLTITLRKFRQKFASGSSGMDELLCVT